MWEKLTNLLKTILVVAKDLEKAQKEIADLREDVTELTLALAHVKNELKMAEVELNKKIELNQQENSHHQERLGYQLQIELMKFEKRLPSGPIDNKET